MRPAGWQFSTAIAASLTISPGLPTPLAPKGRPIAARVGAAAVPERGRAG